MTSMPPACRTITVFVFRGDRSRVNAVSLLLTGRMDEFVRLPGISSQPSRRFGRCV
jgi:hypothetical protein